MKLLEWEMLIEQNVLVCKFPEKKLLPAEVGAACSCDSQCKNVAAGWWYSLINISVLPVFSACQHHHGSIPPGSAPLLLKTLLLLLEKYIRANLTETSINPSIYCTGGLSYMYSFEVVCKYLTLYNK